MVAAAQGTGPLEFSKGWENVGGFGDVADMLIANDMDIRCLQRWIGRDGRTYRTKMVLNRKTGIYEPKAVVVNAPATLTKDAWKLFDDAVVRTAKARLRIVADIRGAGLVKTIPDGMGTTVLEHQTVGSITPATISMDPDRVSERDRPQFDTVGLPLPIIHKDFWFTAREIAVSRRSGVPLDTYTAEEATAVVAEEIEKLFLGTAGSFSYGGYTVYGLTNHPSRNTQTLTTPTTTNQATTITEILQMVQKAQDDRFFGPYIMYYSPNWNQWMDADYSATKGDNTLRQRIQGIGAISELRQADFLTGSSYQLILVQMTSNVVRAVIALDFQTLQWDTEGSMRKNFKVMASIIPQIRADAAGGMGLVHGSN